MPTKISAAIEEKKKRNNKRKKSSYLKLEENPHCPIRFSKPVSSPDFQIVAARKTRRSGRRAKNPLRDSLAAET
jgi:hypothetical protein